MPTTIPELIEEVKRLRRWIEENTEWLGHPAKLDRCTAEGCDNYAAVGWTVCQIHLAVLYGEAGE